jgi:hypothetical protein
MIWNNYTKHILKGAFQIVADFRVSNLSKATAESDSPAKGWQPLLQH